MVCLGGLFSPATAGGQPPPYPPSAAIRGVELDWSTHERRAQGSDNFQLAWAADDHQYGAWGDGNGFAEAKGGRVGLGFARIEGEWDRFRGADVWGGKGAERPATFDGKSWGTVAVGDVLYAWVVPDVPDDAACSGDPPRDHFRYVELARSTNRAATWEKAAWRWRIDDDLTVPTFLVCGKANADARDGYVYSYFIRPQSRSVTQASHGLRIHKPGAVYLARVPKERVFKGRDAYEWFAGDRDGGPVWGTLADKRPVFEDPNGVGWCLSACRAPGLGRYLLCTEHGESHVGLLGLFDAPEPWGPWTTVKHWTPEDRFGERRPGSDLPWRHNVFFAAFAPKWFGPDGRTFSLVFTGGGKGADNDSFNVVRGRFLESVDR